MSDTADRLAAYKASELRILKAQETGFGDRRAKLAELAEVRAAIKDLETQLAAETAEASGARGPRRLVADFSRGIG